MSDRTFKLYDASLIVSAQSGYLDRRLGGAAPDWETFNRLMLALEQAGFSVGRNPRIEEHYSILGKHHRAGARATPAGELRFEAEAYPTGCKVEFYQEVVTVHPTSGRYDFDKRQQMPYLIGKAFEAAVRRLRVHLVARGFAEEVKAVSANPDPLAYFNDRWDSEYDRRRGAHRFDREASGWPSDKALSARDRLDRDGARIEHGDTRYWRNWSGRLMRGRVYGGINGQWLAVFGPGPRDFTHVSNWELFRCDPSSLPRRQHPAGPKRRQEALAAAVAAENFERAILIRDAIRRAA